MKKKLPILAALSGIAVAIGYRAIKGHGVFNRLKYSDVHDAVSRYIDINHPDSTYSAICEAGESYTTIISEKDRKFLLTITLSENGVYIFSEENLTFTS